MIARWNVWVGVIATGLTMISIMIFCSPAIADELVLVNGRIATGIVENPDGDPIYLKSPNGRMAYSKSEISTIHFGAVTSPVDVEAEPDAKTPDDDVRVDGLDDEAVDRIKRLLNSLNSDLDEEEEVGLAEERERIVEMIVAYGEPASQILADKLDSAQAQNAPYMLSALAQVNPKRASSLATRVMSEESSSSMREAAITTLADIDSKANVQAFRNALADPQGGVRAAAVTALGNTRNKAEAESLIPLVNDPSPLVRRRAMKALEHCVGEKHKTPEDWTAWWDTSQATKDRPEAISETASAN
jgi:hypothetical protein